VHVRRLCWLGIPAQEYEPMVELLRGVMGLRVEFDEPGTTELSTEDDDRVQVFAPEHDFFGFSPTPLVMFEVDDLAGARDELVAAGIELVGEAGQDRNWEWLYFRAPDGNLYAFGSRLPV
jgi:hypothetical protein